MRLPAIILAAGAVTGSALIATPPVFAAACAPRDEFAKHLATNYKEKSQSIGVTNDGSLFEVFASDNGSWSLLARTAEKSPASLQRAKCGSRNARSFPRPSSNTELKALSPSARAPRGKA